MSNTYESFIPKSSCNSLVQALVPARPSQRYHVRYHISWPRNGVPHRKPHRDGTDADGGHPREGFRIQP
ncbi:diacylglycerol O-acyltransferase 1 isoform X1, partial [Vespula maculifrons]